eukprot:c24456_g1_i3 orf=250-1971(-)
MLLEVLYGFFCRSPRPASKRRMSRSVSRSPSRRVRRSRSPPRRGRSPNYAQRRSRSPPRRAWSPITTRSPRRRRRSYSRSPRGRSPIATARSPRRRRSPQLSYSPRGRSPTVRSPRRRRSPVFTRSSPRRRKSPPRSPPRYRRRSPRYARSPVRRHPQVSPPVRHRHTANSPQRHTELSPRRRPHMSSPRRGSPSPRRPARSFSPDTFSRSPPQRRDSSKSPQRHSSPSPPRRSTQRLSPSRHNSTSVASPQQKIPPSKGRLSKGSVSPLQQRRLPSYQHHSSRSPSPVVHTVKPLSKAAGSPPRGTNRPVPVQHRTLSPSLSPQMQRRSPSLSEASPPNVKRYSRSPLAGRGSIRDRPMKIEQQNQKISERMVTKRTRSSSRESSLPDDYGQKVSLKKSSTSDVNAGVSSSVIRQAGKVGESIRSVSRSSDDDQHPSPGGRRNTKSLESDGDEDHGTASPVSQDDRRAAKRRRKEERRLRKEEKRRKREERHKRKEEKRANKAVSKGIASVTPPPDFDKRTMKSDDYDSADEGKGGDDEDMDIEQKKLENELRRKALDSIRAKKVVSSGGSF